MNRYQNIEKLKTSTGRTYYRSPLYPAIPLSINDIYVITVSQDRYDRLANQYYADSSLWWIIALANEDQPQDTLYPTPGTQIRIPVNVSDILAEYNRLNAYNPNQ
jgi:nucleoid-associated protein YgaU